MYMNGCSYAFELPSAPERTEEHPLRQSLVSPSVQFFQKTQARLFGLRLTPQSLAEPPAFVGGWPSDCGDGVLNQREEYHSDIYWQN